MKERIKKIEKKIEDKVDSKITLFKIFNEPRPKYVAHVTVTDKIINKLFLWMFPQSVKPNHVTIFRFITVPFLIVFLLLGYYKITFVLFVISAFSDAVDGAMARTRNQITDWGIVFDPFADKLLIGTVGGIVIFKFLNPLLALSIIFIELVLIASSYYRFKGEVVPAKAVGKIKMILQCVGVGFVFLFMLTESVIFLTIATYVLCLAVFFAVLSVLIYKSI